MRAVTTALIHGSIWDEGLDARRRAFGQTVVRRVAASSAAAMLLGPVFYRATLEGGALTPDVLEASLDAVGNWSQPAPTAR